jgi:glycosyltransferase involved in cell wall biosynthesis
MPKISVLLTAYNRERYIAAAIESVLGQTFEDFELLVVDDCSSDGTVEIARSYERTDRRVRVVVNPRNLGQFPNRNHAASLARGRYLKFHDSDDLMYPHCLETMVAALDAEPRAGFALSTAWAWPGGPCPVLSTPRMNYQREFLGFGMFMCGPSCAMFRADVFRGLGGFDDIGVPSDHTFWLKACARHSVLLLSADLFWYRQHPGQELQSDRAARQYAEVPGYVWTALNSPECPLSGHELERARSNQAFSTAKQIYRHLRRRQWSLAAHRLRRSGLTAGEWFRYLRRPQRSALAGTPLDANGEFLVPDSLRQPSDLSIR